MELTLFQQMAMVLVLATALGAVAIFLRQPLVAAFIVLGIAAGPAGLGLVEKGEPLDSLAQLGIALLLFLVGLRLDLNVIRRMGVTAAIAGLAQVVVTAALGFAVARGCGIGALGAALVGVALSFSSTVIVVKLLADRREIDSLHGRLAVGILIVQDLVVIVALIALSAIRQGTDGLAGPGVIDFALRGTVLVAALAALGRFVLPRVLHAFARSTEALVLFGIAWAVFVGAASERLGFSLELGAFLAGVSIASTRYRDAIGGRLTSVRDFLLLFFFVALGATLTVDSIWQQLPMALAFSAFVLLVKPAVAMAILLALGYGRRTSFVTALALGQISEFSLILVATAATLGHLERESIGAITLVALVTIVVSSATIVRSQSLYERLAPALGRAFHRRPETSDGGAAPSTCDVVIVGLGRYGSNIATILTERGVRVVGADFDPEAVASARRKGIPALYADIEDPEQVRNLPLDRARCVVSALPQRELNVALFDALRASGYSGRVALCAHSHADASALVALGATHVFLPFLDAAKEASDRIVEVSAEPR